MKTNKQVKRTGLADKGAYVVTKTDKKVRNRRIRKMGAEQTKIPSRYSADTTYTVNGQPAEMERVWDGAKWVSRLSFKTTTT